MSRDDWFRPVFLAHGPDGALYVCDMYRKTIEHPQYLPGEVRKHTDFENGKDTVNLFVRESLRSVRRNAVPSFAAVAVGVALGHDDKNRKTHIQHPLNHVELLRDQLGRLGETDYEIGEVTNKVSGQVILFSPLFCNAMRMRGAVV